jgi:hypothetical protein
MHPRHERLRPLRQMLTCRAATHSFTAGRPSVASTPRALTGYAARTFMGYESRLG